MLHPLKVHVGQSVPSVVNLRCPLCRHTGAFNGLPNCNDVTWLSDVKAMFEQMKGIMGDG